MTTTAAPRYVLVNNWVCLDTGKHNCVGGGPEGHEPGCGLEPIDKVDGQPVVLRPGDVLVVGVDRDLSVAAVAELKAKWDELVPGVRAVFISSVAGFATIPGDAP